MHLRQADVNGEAKCMSELEVQNLVKRIHGKTVVDRISFRIAEDELLVLLGPAGSGKTTILRLISGLDEPDTGRIILNGRNISALEPQMRNIGVAFQDYKLYPNMNIFDNIAFGLQSRGVARKEIETRITKVGEILGLTDMLKRSPASLAGGDLQRIALARVMVKEADLYLFDQLIPYLEPRLRHRMRQEIVLLQRNRLKPSLYVTQDQHEAFAMSKRIGVISQGRLLQIGTPDELLYRPANLFVAQYLGEPPMNILEGLVRHVGARYQLFCGDIMVTLPTRWTRMLSRMGPQGRVFLGIRPGMLIPEWAAATLNNTFFILLRVQIRHVEPGIGRSTVQLMTSTGLELSAEFEDMPHIVLRYGQVITVGVDVERICFFHPQTGELLS
ncbi:MAG TPA: ABC transporter ATP-binding protein [Ktedonobacteraceae bacterium]|nr:ABC transporter ATP-binding protein [Ktedonobacteraceae bacterium]